MFLNAILHSEILLKFHQKCGFFKYLTFNLVCLSQKWCNLTKIHYIRTYMMCSKGKATFGPIFDQVLQALINTLGPQCTQYFTVLYSNAQYSTVLHSTPQNNNLLHINTRYCTVLHGTSQYYTELHLTAQ